ncbi:uncharacterized protein LOC124136929 [Haliotis rufescens]|uniref:uncharacterized protein LOC124136929 n=1 Tax=Haliotis rufescens TaxID=6454 RepID=UPI00201F3E4F|nr:uncharacterized protein LOC124136929 [Haliotis rufescens]
MWLSVSVRQGKVMLVKTSGDQTKSVFLNDKGVHVAGEKSLIMDIKACAEAVVQFAQTQHLTGGFFEVYLGSRDNSMSMVRFSGKKKKESVRGSPLDCKDFRTFWFSWEDEGTLHVGSGSVIGVREFLSLEVEDAVEIHYVVVYTAMGNEGEWRVLRDSRPEFVHPNRDGSTVINVREDTPAHGVIYELKARDPDEDDISYHVIGQYSDVFGVTRTNLKILTRLDYESKQNYVVTISASDGKHEVRQSMMVSVVDLVDEVPVIGPPVLTTILEELPVGTPIGHLATVVDRDRGAKLKYSLRGRDSQYFNINTKTGDVRMRKRLDRDKRNGRHVLDQLYLTVDDQIHLQEKKLHVSVIDINDNPPMFGKTIYRVTVKENMFKDMVIANLSCVDIDDAANSIFSLVVSSVETQKAPIKAGKTSKTPSSTTPNSLGDRSSSPGKGNSTSESPPISDASSGHPEYRLPTVPVMTDGKAERETTSRGREMEDGLSKELTRPWFPHGSDSRRGTKKQDQFQNSASQNTGGKDVVGRNVRSTNFQESIMTPHYFGDKTYDDSFNKKNAQPFDNDYQPRRNGEKTYKDDSVGRKDRPRYDPHEWNERHKDKSSHERVTETYERHRDERRKPDYDHVQQSRDRDDDHHHGEADLRNRRKYAGRPQRYRYEDRRSNDYYYDYDNHPNRYQPYRRPPNDGYRRRRRWHEDEIRGSSWVGDSESHRAPVKAPVPDNWADLLKHDEPYLGPRRDDEPKHLEDVLKPLNPSKSINNAIGDEEPMNIITKADQEKIRNQMRSSISEYGDETTVHASDTTPSLIMTTKATLEDLESPHMPHGDFSDSSEQLVHSESFEDTLSATTEFPGNSGIGTENNTTVEDKTVKEDGDGRDNDADGDGDALGDTDDSDDSLVNGTSYETSTSSDKESSIDEYSSRGNSSTNASSNTDFDYDTLYNKFVKHTTEDSQGVDGVTEATNDKGTTEGSESDINNNDVNTNKTDPNHLTTNQNNSIGNTMSSKRKKRSSLKNIFGGKFRRYLKKTRKLRKAKAALKVIGRLLSNARRRNRRRKNDRWEKAIRKFLKTISSDNNVQSDVSGRESFRHLLRDVLVHHERSRGNSREKLTNQIPMDEVYISDPTQVTQSKGDQENYLTQKMGQKLFPEQQYIPSLFRHFHDDRQNYDDRRLKQRYPNSPSSWRHIRPNRPREAPFARQTSKFPYYLEPWEQTSSSTNHNDRLRHDINDAFPFERHGFEPWKYQIQDERLPNNKPNKPLKPSHHHQVQPSRDDGRHQPLSPGQMPSSYTDMNNIRTGVQQLDYFENTNALGIDGDTGSEETEYQDSVPDNYLTGVSGQSPEILNNDVDIGREGISAARAKVYEELGLEPNLQNLDYDYLDPMDTGSNIYETDYTKDGEQTPSEHRPTDKGAMSYNSVDQSKYLTNGVPYSPQQKTQDYRHSEKGNSKANGYNEIINHADIEIPSNNDDQQNGLEELSNAVDSNHYVGPPLSSLAKLHIEPEANTDKVPMNDFVLVPKDAIAKSLEREADALGIQLQQSEPSVNSDYKYQNRIGKRNRVGHQSDSYFVKRQNVKSNSLKGSPRMSSRIRHEHSFPQELVDLVREDSMISSSPHFPPVSAYKKSRFLDKLDQRIFNRNKDTLSSHGRPRTSQADARKSQGTSSNRPSLKNLLRVAVTVQNPRVEPGHMQHSSVGMDGKKIKSDLAPNHETSYLRHLMQLKSFAPESNNQARHLKLGKRPGDTDDSEFISERNEKVKKRVLSPSWWKQGRQSNPTLSPRRLPKRDTAKMAKPMFEARGLSIWANSKTVDFDTMGEGDHTYTLTVLAIDRPEYGSPQTGTTMVLVQVLPVNEFTPEWTDHPVNDSGWFPSLLVRENVTVGTKLITLGATDRDGGEDGRITYTLTKITAANGKSAIEAFAIEPDTGTLTNAVKLDRDPRTGGVTHYDLVITASDNGENPFSTQGRMRISLVDVNDNPPEFVKQLYEAILPSEWTELSNWKLQLAVMDHDRKATFKFKIVKGDSSTFNIHENTGIITVRGTPDKTLPYKVLTVSASDGGTPELTSSTQVIIHTQKYSFDQVRAAIDARTKSSGPWVFKMLSGVFGIILLFMIIFYVTKKYGLCSSVVRPDMDKTDDDVSVNRSRVINIAPPPDVTNRADNSGIEQSVDEGQDGHAQESISSMGPAYTGLKGNRRGER